MSKFRGLTFAARFTTPEVIDRLCNASTSCDETAEMDSERRKSSGRFVLLTMFLLLFLLLSLYGIAYVSLVSPTRMEWKDDAMRHVWHDAYYFYGSSAKPKPLGSGTQWFFWPANLLDRRVRPHLWREQDSPI